MIRAYQPTDLKEVMDIFLMNVPDYFAPEEQAELERYLDENSEHYFVYLEEQKIVGAGGYNCLPPQGRISWYFIHPDYQGRGIGRALAQHALEGLKQHKDIDQIIVRTSQHAWPFFKKLGFDLIKKEKNFWAPGFDLYEMEYQS